MNKEVQVDNWKVEKDLSIEIRVMKCIPAEGITNENLMSAAGQELYKIGFSYCMKNKWIKKDKASGLITPLVSGLKDDLQVWILSAFHKQTTLMDLKNTNGAIDKIIPGSAEAKLLIRRQMISLV